MRSSSQSQTSGTPALERQSRSICITRRGLLFTAAAGAVTLSIPALAEGEAEPQRTALFEEAYKKIVAGREPEQDGVTLELPERAENGNIVPYRIAVASPMTADEHVRTLYLLSTSNPHAEVAAFSLTPQSGKAEVAGRMRLAKTQDVICLAELSNGKLLMGTTRVEVEIGGCGN